MDATERAQERLAEQGLPIPTDGTEPKNGQPPGLGRFIIPHYATFTQVAQLISRSYRWRFDEALKHSRENALAMRRDAFVMDCIRSRQMPTAQLAWHIETDDDNNAYQKQAADGLTKIVQQIPRFQKMKMSLLEGIWYGRYGCQTVYQWDYTLGYRRLVVRDFAPVNGDKLIFKFGGRVGILVHRVEYQGSWEPTERGPAHFLDNQEREQFVVHEHEIDDADYWEGEMSGGIHGVGIRSRIYWLWWLRQEVLSWMLEYLERVGMGFNIFYYESGNPESEAKAREAATTQSRNNVVLWPRPIGAEKQGPGVEHIEPSMAGAQFLHTLINEYFDNQIRSYILGQTLSSKTEATGMGSSVAEFHQQTLARILKFDAINLQETLTRDLVNVLLKYNYPHLPRNCLRLVFDLDKPDPKAYLEAAQIFQNMGGDVDEDELRGVIGLAKPKPGSGMMEGHKQQRLMPPGMMPGDDSGVTMPQDEESLPNGDMSNRERSRFAKWDESKHPRGQPENSGKFASAQGGVAVPTDNDSHFSETTKSAEEVASDYVQKAVSIPARLMAKAKRKVSDAYERLAARYGSRQAKIIVGAALVGTLAIPIPFGSVLAAAPLVALAEVYRAVAGDKLIYELSENLTEEEIEKEAGNLLKTILKFDNPATHSIDQENDPDAGGDRSRFAKQQVAGHSLSFEESKHPRDDHGRFISKEELHTAKRDPKKADELRARVTDPEQRAKLEEHLAGPALTKAKKAVAPKRAAPGSQLAEKHRAKLRKFGMVGTFPPADVPMSDVKIADLSRDHESLTYEPLMSWKQTTKSGRVSRQYRYTQVFHDRNATEKFTRVSLIEPHIDKIGEVLTSQMSATDLPRRQREAAAIASAIRETGLRPTDGDESIKHGHFGISSLQARHVKVLGSQVHLDFIGKEGIRNQTVIREPSNVAFFKEALTGKAENDFVFSEANSDHAGDALKEASKTVGGPADIKIKDLRTLKATQTARQVVSAYDGPPPPLSGNKAKDVKAIQSAILKMSGQVAAVLNNTAQQAKMNYIHPKIWLDWQSKLTNVG